MKNWQSTITALILVALCNSCTAKESRQKSTSIRTTHNPAYSSRYNETECENIYKGERHSGIYCLSGDRRLLNDLGVFISNNYSETETSEPIIHIEIASGTSSYEAKPKQINNQLFYTATVDCNEGDEAIYRATSTCFVGISLKEGHQFQYIEATLVDNIDNKDVLTPEDIANLIKRSNKPHDSRKKQETSD